MRPAKILIYEHIDAYYVHILYMQALHIFFLRRTMPDTEATVTVGIALAAANPSQQGHWQERRSFIGFVTNFKELGFAAKAKKKSSLKAQNRVPASDSSAKCQAEA